MNQHFAKPRKALGQNFLQDAHIIRKIVDALNIQAGDTVIEIGPGRGALTEQILPVCDNLHIIEFDYDLSAYWTSRADSVRNLTVHAVDILKFDLSVIINNGSGLIKLVGNLPYNISSPVLFYLTEYCNALSTQVLMLQKEVVDRMVSSPGSKQYGRLSVMLQQQYAIERLFGVPPNAFYPPPKVESAIAQLTPLDPPPYKIDDQSGFAKLVKQAFSQRRKTLKNTLKGLLLEEQIASVGVDPHTRAETLSVSDFVALSNLPNLERE